MAVTIAGTDHSVSLPDVARAAHDPAHIPPGEEGALVEWGEFTATAVAFPNGTHVCEVDPNTGVTEIMRYSAAAELGRMLSRAVCASGAQRCGVCRAASLWPRQQPVTAQDRHRPQYSPIQPY